MSETEVKQPLIDSQNEKTIIVKKDKKAMKKEKLFKLGSKLFLIFNILTIAYTLLFIISYAFGYCLLIWRLPRGFKSAFKYIVSKNNEAQLEEVLNKRQQLQSQIDYFNKYLSYYRWKSIPYFFKTYIFGGLKAFLKTLNPIFLVKFLFKYVIYGLPKEIIRNLFFKVNNFYYLALISHILAMGSLIHFQKFQQRTLRVFSEMSNYDAMSVNYLQLVLLAVLAILSTPAFVKLIPFMAVSLASILKNDQQKKVIQIIPWAFIGSVVPYLLITLLLRNGEGFFCLLYTMIIVLKCKFNKFDNLILLKIVALLDDKITKKYSKKNEKGEEDDKLKKWNSVKRSIIAETVML